MDFFNWLIKKIEAPQLAKEFASFKTGENFSLGTPPKAQDIEFLQKTLREDPDFFKLTPTEKVSFVELILQLERTKPIVTPDKKNIAAQLRLLILKDVAKITFFRETQSLPSLRAIIVYTETSFLSSHSDAVGLAGPMAQKKYFSIHRVIELMTAMMPGIPDLKDLKTKNVPSEKDAQNLCRSFEEMQILLQNKTSSQDILDKYSIKWTGFKSIFIKLIKAVTTAYPQLGESFLNNAIAIEDWLPDTLEEYLEEYDRTQHTMIHLSWKTQEFVLKVSNTHHILIHELAHVIDFESQTSEPWVQAWQEQFEIARNGKMKFLRNYALTNPKEFFAVSSEFFFLQHDLILKKAPKLFELLKSTYGFVPTVKRKSLWARFTNYLHYFRESEGDHVVALIEE